MPMWDIPEIEDEPIEPMPMATEMVIEQGWGDGDRNDDRSSANSEW